MKKLLRSVSIAAALLLCSTRFLHAQMPGNGANPLNPAMLKMFGSHTNFSATIDVQVSGKSGPLEMTSKIAFAGQKIRAEMDLTTIKGKAFSPELLAQMKKMGMDATTILVRPDKGVNFMMYPNLSAYVELPLSDAEKKALTQEPKIVTTALGKETIDGHPSVKNKVVVTDDNGKTQEMMVWNATDLKNFPVQMEITEKGSTILTKFKNVQFVKSDAKLFEPPTEFKKYAGMAELQQMMMQRMMEALQK